MSIFKPRAFRGVLAGAKADQRLSLTREPCFEGNGVYDIIKTEVISHTTKKGNDVLALTMELQVVSHDNPNVVGKVASMYARPDLAIPYEQLSECFVKANRIDAAKTEIKDVRSIFDAAFKVAPNEDGEDSPGGPVNFSPGDLRVGITIVSKEGKGKHEGSTFYNPSFQMVNENGEALTGLDF